MMGTFAAILCILAAVAVLAVVCWLAIRYDAFTEDIYFDERQALAQGKGYKLAFWVGIIYYPMATFILMFQKDAPLLKIEPYLLVFIGLALQVITFHLYCLLTHSVLPLGGKAKGTIGCYVFLGLVQIWSLLEENVRFDGYPLTGQGSGKWVHLIVAVTAFLLAGAHLLSLLWKEKDSEG